MSNEYKRRNNPQPSSFWNDNNNRGNNQAITLKRNFGDRRRLDQTQQQQKKENRKKRKESVYQLAWLRLIDAHASKVGERVIGLETKSYPRAPSDKRKSNITEDYFFFLLSFIGWLHAQIISISLQSPVSPIDDKKKKSRYRLLGHGIGSTMWFGGIATQPESREKKKKKASFRFDVYSIYRERTRRRLGLLYKWLWKHRKHGMDARRCAWLIF